jgi:hypothetical protein
MTALKQQKIRYSAFIIDKKRIHRESVFFYLLLLLFTFSFQHLYSLYSFFFTLLLACRRLRSIHLFRHFDSRSKDIIQSDPHSLSIYMEYVNFEPRQHVEYSYARRFSRRQSLLVYDSML